MYAFWNDLLGLEAVKPEELTYSQVALRAFLVYGALILLVRLGKKRFLAQATPFDMILVVLIGAVASRAISGSAPFFSTLLALVVLVTVHYVFSFLSSRWTFFSGLVKGNPTVIVKDGQIDSRAMKASHMSPGDLDEDLRKQGVVDPKKVQEARLERDGTLSVLQNK